MPDPAVSFEVGFFTADDVRERKVWDVNWLMRKTRVLTPRPPQAGNDALKRKVFDAIATATRRGGEFRGV